ncbi:MAG TPA: histidine kinase [Trebonia sp.]|jgi:signal transduction histidine kinase
MADSTPGSRRDLMTDLACVLVSAVGGMILLITKAGTQGAGWIPGPASVAYGVDVGIGLLASAMLWFRRRWPTGVAVAVLVPMVLARSAQVASLISVLNVSLRRRPAVAVTVAVAHQVAFIGFSLLWITYPWWLSSLWVLTYHVALVALGMYARARRKLVASLHEQVRQAEAAQHLMAEQARRAERARIAVEMHDVLAHRVSLMALHAGGLEVRPDLAPEAVRETARLIRSTARQALTELRDVIGVLRDTEDAEAPHGPQPRLRDIAHLVSGYRQAGLNVELDLRVEEPDAAPGPLGRDAYRIVREALTNVSKHARGTAATVSLAGRPGEGLRVTVRNKLPVSGPPAAELPGAGLGLVSLAERVALAGGTLAHGLDDRGDFVLTATLHWEG